MGYGLGKFGRGGVRLPRPQGEVAPGLALRDPRQTGGGPDGGPYHIFGRPATDLEWFTYQSLRRLGWRDRDIQFQAPFLGGRLPGGVVLDFIVWTPAGPAIVEPNGDYWHRSSLELVERDRARRAAIAAAWRRPFRYKELTPPDFDSDARTDEVLQEFLGRG